MPRLSKSPNLKVFLRTAIVATDRDAATGSVLSVTAVQRKARAGIPEWSARLSDELPDWYSPTNSSAFTKREFKLTGKVFIDGTPAVFYRVVSLDADGSCTAESVALQPRSLETC